VLFVAFASVLATAVGDTMASYQMTHDRYRWVPFVRALRRAQWLAIIGGLAFVVVSMAASPLLSVTAFLAACVVAMLSQFRALTCGANYQALMRGFMPLMLLSMGLVNFPGWTSQTFPRLELSGSAFAALLLLSTGYWYVAHQRTVQDLLRLRD
jgi:uncharacterized membrane protein YdcZ (DUF606 family)